jgi:5-formyltetrahydrofolate cyclo-ligase
MMDKKGLRKYVLAYRQMLAPAEYERRNRFICQKVREYVYSGSYHALHVFLPILRNKEPDLRGIFDELWADHIRLFTSVTDFKEKEMRHYEIHPSTKYVEGALGIPVPIEAPEVDIHEVDIVFVPLLMIDKRGHRLGYGGGYYDRLLKNFGGHSVGISLSSPVDYLHVDPWDRPVDKTIFYTPFT